MKTGIANLPLHHGKAPRWLFAKMVELGREISLAVIEEFGREEFLKRLSDPYWFQALGCVLGYDWHSSGLTTVTCGALKEGLSGIESYTGIFVCGGKGATSRKTPSEIETFFENFQFSNPNFQTLIYASKMSAKVDNTALQDGYQLYHHNFFFDQEGNWTVVQQGMNLNNRMARRYHWFSRDLSDFVCEPESAICCDRRGSALNLVANESKETRNLSVELTTAPKTVLGDLKTIERLDMPRKHWINRDEKYKTKYLERILGEVRERKPQNFEALLATPGVGPKTIRALSLVSELIYGAKPSYKDPARFSFAHGGKDGVPFPVDKKLYDQSIEILRRGIRKAKIETSEKQLAFKRLPLTSGARFLSPNHPLTGRTLKSGGPTLGQTFLPLNSTS